jgi:hypothetical protein
MGVILACAAGANRCGRWLIYWLQVCLRTLVDILAAGLLTFGRNDGDC